MATYCNDCNSDKRADVFPDGLPLCYTCYNRRELDKVEHYISDMLFSYPSVRETCVRPLDTVTKYHEWMEWLAECSEPEPPEPYYE